MPYGPQTDAKYVVLSQSFNPSYGLHALRANLFPYFYPNFSQFQSLIWVACPTGQVMENLPEDLQEGFNPSYGLHALRAIRVGIQPVKLHGFNPSYGLHALRAQIIVLKNEY